MGYEPGGGWLPARWWGWYSRERGEADEPPPPGPIPLRHTLRHGLEPHRVSRGTSFPHALHAPEYEGDYQSPVAVAACLTHGAASQVHLAPGQYERWQPAAESTGVSLAEFVRPAVEDRIAGARRGDLRAGGARVAADLLPEIERLLMERLPGASPATEPRCLLRYRLRPVPVGPRAWDPSCYTADLHRHGVVCTECGGSFLGRR